MPGAGAHVSRHPLAGGGELNTVADETDGIDRLVAAEQDVARGFASHCGWPHSRVNLFIFEDLQPLIGQLQRASRTLGEGKGAAATALQALQGKPMVHIYSVADLSECSVFVNRALMKRLGMWTDAKVIEGLLAHEHAHPLAENATTRAARDLKVAFAQKAGGTGAETVLPAVSQGLERLAHELCLHAPHEVFANELAIRAGFGDALFALNRLSLTGGRAGMAAHAALAAHLKGKSDQGELTEEGAALLLLLASLEAHVRVALETAAFARAGHHAEARALEDLLWREALSHVEVAVGDIYRKFYDSYSALTAEMSRDSVREWVADSFAAVLGVVARLGFQIDAIFHY
jgi:hypothetical protein